jgi:hypothetical protein
MCIGYVYSQENETNKAYIRYAYDRNARFLSNLGLGSLGENG